MIKDVDNRKGIKQESKPDDMIHVIWMRCDGLYYLNGEETMLRVEATFLPTEVPGTMILAMRTWPNMHTYTSIEIIYL
jgi:hypothetical protein